MIDKIRAEVERGAMLRNREGVHLLAMIDALAKEGVCPPVKLCIEDGAEIGAKECAECIIEWADGQAKNDS